VLFRGDWLRHTKVSAGLHIPVSESLTVGDFGQADCSPADFADSPENLLKKLGKL
jgi:hypothetical protein